MSELYPLMEHDPPPPRVERERLSWLAVAICAPPVLWVLQLLVLSAFTNYACFPAEQPLAGPISSMRWIAGLVIAGDVIAIVIAAAAGLISLSYFRIARNLVRAHVGEALTLWRLNRLWFMALGGVLSSAGFLVAIVFEVIASLMVMPCGG